MGHITASDIGFRIAPRINAAGRLDSATAVIELLNERDPIEAGRKATELDQVNQRREVFKTDSFAKPLPKWMAIRASAWFGAQKTMVGIAAWWES